MFLLISSTAMLLAITLVCLVRDLIQTGTHFGVCTNGTTGILLNAKVAKLVSPSVDVRQLLPCSTWVQVSLTSGMLQQLYMPAPLTGQQAVVHVTQIWMYSSASHNGNIQY